MSIEEGQISDVPYVFMKEDQNHSGDYEFYPGLYMNKLLMLPTSLYTRGEEINEKKSQLKTTLMTQYLLAKERDNRGIVELCNFLIDIERIPVTSLVEIIQDLEQYQDRAKNLLEEKGLI